MFALRRLLILCIEISWAKKCSMLQRVWEYGKEWNSVSMLKHMMQAHWKRSLVQRMIIAFCEMKLVCYEIIVFCSLQIGFLIILPLGCWVSRNDQFLDQTVISFWPKTSILRIRSTLVAIIRFSGSFQTDDLWDSPAERYWAEGCVSIIVRRG